MHRASRDPERLERCIRDLVLPDALSCSILVDLEGDPRRVDTAFGSLFNVMTGAAGDTCAGNNCTPVGDIICFSNGGYG